MTKWNGRTITDDKEIAIVFNKCFASVGLDLAKHIPEIAKSPAAYLNISQLIRLFLRL